MLKRSIDIERYSWHVDFFFALTHYEQPPILSCLRSLDASRSVMERVREKMTDDDVNTGFTYSNPRKRSSVVVIGKSSCGAEFLNSFCHELRHLTDDIALEEGMQIAGEEPAYLTGDIALLLSDIVCKLTCKHCRGEGNEIKA